MKKLAESLEPTAPTASQADTEQTSSRIDEEWLECGCPAYGRQGWELEHNCCRCKDSLFVTVRDMALPVGAIGWIQSVPCQCVLAQPTTEELRRERYAEWLMRTRIPLEHQHCRFLNFDPRPDKSALDACRKWVTDFPRMERVPFLLLESPSKGCGKTHLAVACGIELKEKQAVESRFWPVTELLRRYRATMHDGATETVEGIDAEMRRVPLLILDDLGKEKTTDWTRDVLYDLINYRYSHRLPTIVTTNEDLGGYDEAIASRVRSGVAVPFRGRDRRTAA